MAGDWIKIECTTPDKPEIVRMSDTLRIDQDAVVGKLLRVWVWADQNSVAGESITITAAFIDRLTNRKGFAAAMRAAGWLLGDDGAMTFPSFERHNGMTAKMRADSNRRMKKSRETKPDCDRNVAVKAQQKAQPELEKRERREGDTDRPPEIPPSVPAALPPDANADRESVKLPTLAQVTQFAPSAGVTPQVAEIWWNECEARPLAPTGHYTDRDGNAIRNWQAHMKGYAMKWQSNDARRGGTAAPAGKSKPIVDPDDWREFLATLNPPREYVEYQFAPPFLKSDFQKTQK